jgi:hypothetical protein
VGTGLDRVYPKAHLAIWPGASRNTACCSANTRSAHRRWRRTFPRRNRLIAGIAQGTLVVEAALQSGSLITARLTVEQGKDVFAIPGSIHATQSRGCHALIKQGAKLVESAQDVLEEGGWGQRRTARATQAQPGRRRYARDAPQTCWRRWVSTRSAWRPCWPAPAWTTAHLQAQLMALELQGQVARLPGGLFQRIAGLSNTGPAASRAGSNCAILAPCSKFWCSSTKTTGAATPAPVGAPGPQAERRRLRAGRDPGSADLAQRPEPGHPGHRTTRRRQAARRGRWSSRTGLGPPAAACGSIRSTSRTAWGRVPGFPALSWKPATGAARHMREVVIERAMASNSAVLGWTT